MADPRSGTGPVIRSVEFYNIELAPLADGRVYVSMLATTVDDQEPQLLTQEIARDTVATIEDALSVIRQGAARACPGPLRSRPRLGEQPRAVGNPDGSFLLVLRTPIARKRVTSRPHLWQSTMANQSSDDTSATSASNRTRQSCAARARRADTCSSIPLRTPGK